MAEEKSTTFGEVLNNHRVSRRDFLRFTGLLTATLALPTTYAKVIAQALETTPRIPVIWQEMQSCTGDTESFIRSGQRTSPIRPDQTNPSIIDLLLDYISLDYHETLMVAAGSQAILSMEQTVSQYAGQYIAIIEGSIPMANGGIYCTINGKTALWTAQHVVGNARATLAVGSCAYDGGLASASPNLTGATGVLGAVPGAPNLMCLPGCPANVVNIVASIVYFQAFGSWPAMDSKKRPYFAYGEEIHEECERHDFYEDDQFVEAWGDAGHRAGWCLYKMGCRGPSSKNNCNVVRWNDGTNWDVRAGHGCIACASPHFWDNQSPFYTANGSGDSHDD